MTRVKCPRCFHVNPAGQETCAACHAPLPKQPGPFGNPGSQGNAAPQSPPQPAASSNEAFVHFHQGQVVANRYTVYNVIGRGGMGCIYKVHDNVLGEFVALKTLLPQYGRDKLVLERFFNEARIARRLAHPNIVRVHDIGKANDLIYISMECVEGKSLRAMLEQTPPGETLPLPVVLKFFDALCAALEYSHRFTVHRDIKPENVMVDQSDTVKLMDFGISKLMADNHLTGASLVMGTPFYMSPEQMKNSRDVDARADIYSMGVMLYEVLTGRLPTGVAKPITEINRNVPAELERIVERCVEEDAENRFQNATALRLALRQVAIQAGHPLGPLSDSDSTSDSSSLPPVRTAHQRSLRPVLGWIMAALLLLLSGAGMYAVEQLYTQHAAGAGNIPVQSNNQFDALAEDVETVQAIAQRFAADNEARKALYDQAQRTWDNAEAQYENGAAPNEENNAPGDALQTARAALQSFMAAVLMPEEMRWVPAGEVEVNAVTHYVPGFFIDQYEVTLEKYHEFATSIADGWPMPPEIAPHVESYGDYPMVQVRFFDAQAYAAWNGLQLPTEVQWARAAYGEEAASEYPWSNETAANQSSIEAVGSNAEDESWVGCLDMAGNVSEWTRTSAQPETTHEDGTTPYFGTQMIIKGGNYAQPDIPMDRSYYVPFETQNPLIGFRCTQEVDTHEEAVDEFISQYRNAEPEATEEDSETESESAS